MLCRSHYRGPARCFHRLSQSAFRLSPAFPHVARHHPQALTSLLPIRSLSSNRMTQLNAWYTISSVKQCKLQSRNQVLLHTAIYTGTVKPGSEPSWAETLRNDRKNSSELFFQFGRSSLAKRFEDFSKKRAPNGSLFLPNRALYI